MISKDLRSLACNSSIIATAAAEMTHDVDEWTHQQKTATHKWSLCVFAARSNVRFISR